jgi:hypothetical protein
MALAGFILGFALGFGLCWVSGWQKGTPGKTKASGVDDVSNDNNASFGR